MILELKNLNKNFGDLTALENINLKVEKNQVIALIGPSGSGKSTILRSINFLEQISSGEIWFNNTKLSNENINLYRPKIGMVFQHFNLFPHLSVIENITFAPIKVLQQNKKNAEEYALNLLEKVGLTDKAYQKPSMLSGGQKQRVAIARSLAMQPEILLLDEPTSALDPEMVKEVLEVIQSFVHTGITILMATHEMSFARNAADKIVFLNKGKIIEEASPAEFFLKPKSARAAEFLAKLI